MRISLTMETTAKFKQKEFAEKTGLSRSYICEVLNKKRRPSWDVAKCLANETGTSPMLWMEGTVDDIKNALSFYAEENE